MLCSIVTYEISFEYAARDTQRENTLCLLALSLTLVCYVRKPHDCFNKKNVKKSNQTRVALKLFNLPLYYQEKRSATL